MGESLDSRGQQASVVRDRLAATYPDATISLRYSDRLELLIAVILSAQCTDERVNSVTADLFATYDGAADYAAADEEVLAEQLNSITYYNNKARYIRESSRRIVTDHGGEVPDTMSELTDLPGVGRKTANVVLQHGNDVVEGIVVDTHVERLSRRLGLTEADTPERIETDLMDVLPRDRWREFTHLLISHGRATCTARSPDCPECVLEDVCPSSKLDNEVDRASGEPWK
ncbi:endonuclease III [Halobacteriales archaeon QH_8_64_26]|nr:MAG: endonuclease III [Halobacteriales archaeon QH_8_64_26]